MMSESVPENTIVVSPVPSPVVNDSPEICDSVSTPFETDSVT